MAATRAVTVQRAFRRVMLAVDGPENSALAVDLAITLAALNGADLSLVHVVTNEIPFMGPPAYGFMVALPRNFFDEQEQQEKRLSRWLERLAGAAEERGVSATVHLIHARASVAEEVAKKASDEEADLIVVGMNDRNALERLVLGSTSRAVIQRASCPVLVAR
jgi:nucleotide-binding universal stress UspA family protein